MMPFSPLRTWGLGLVSWIVIGAGIYCLWEWADGIHPAVVARPSVQETDGPSNTQNLPAERPVIVKEADSRGGWLYLLAAVALLATSGGGFFPVSWLLSRPGPHEPRAEPAVEEQWITRPDGARLYVESFGPRGAPTLVLTHGWSLDRTVWFYAKRELGQRFRLLLWDLRGLGRSSGPKNNDFSIDAMAHDLDAVVAAAGPGPVILVGHSIGGMITQTFCRLFPRQMEERVAGIVLLHTTYMNPLRTAFLAQFWTAIERPILVPLNWLTIWLAPVAWLSNWQSYLNGSLHLATRIASFAGTQTRQQLDYGAWLAAIAWPGVVARGNLAMLNFDEQATLRGIEVPVLVIGARHDRMTLAEASDHMERLLPHGLPARTTTGHLSYWEEHAKVAELIGEFVARFERRTEIPAAETASLTKAARE